jgi:hypothetical protein
MPYIDKTIKLIKCKHILAKKFKESKNLLSLIIIYVFKKPYYFLSPFIAMVRVTANPPHKIAAPNMKNTIAVAVILSHLPFIIHEIN